MKDNVTKITTERSSVKTAEMVKIVLRIMSSNDDQLKRTMESNLRAYDAIMRKE